MRIVAILMVRDGIDYIDSCLQHLLNNNIEVIVVDHESSDGSFEACEKFLNHGVCELNSFAYSGYFSLEDQLKLKGEIIDRLETDWIIHQDIDECLESPKGPSQRLFDAIKEVDKNGYDVINFDEFVFLPLENIMFQESPYYYYFQPFQPRLMRAWKKSSKLSALHSGGHVLNGEFNLNPENFNLKHHIFTSQDHAYDKYANREFSSSELKKGWHLNRVSIDKNRLKFPNKKDLEFHDSSSNAGFNTTNPWLKHYWEQN